MQKVWPLLFAATAAFALATGCWAVWGLMTPGDFFANGNPLVYPTLVVAVGCGTWLGFNARSLWQRSLIVLAAAAALCFHVFIPDGWWATPPGGSL